MDFSSKKENIVSEKLTQLGINISSIKYEDFSPVKISIECKEKGVLKSSEGTQKFWKFNKINFLELKSAERKIILTRFPATETDLHDIVDGLSKVLHVDSSGRNKLQEYELIIYRNDLKSDFPIREWKDFNDYDIELKGLAESKLITLDVQSK